MMNDVLTRHLAAAEAEGRTLSDAEAALIEAVAATSEPAPVVEAGYVPARVDSEAGERARYLEATLEAVQERKALNIRAAAVHYDTARPAGVAHPAPGRLVDYLKSLGAVSLGEQARSFQVPKIASGDAQKWTPGQAKAEIVTELATVPADVIAAWTSVTSTGFLDISGLEVILEGMLARRVVVQENAAIAASLVAQASTPLDATTYAGTVSGAITEGMLEGASSLVLLVGPNVAASVLESGGVGPFGRDGDYRGTLMGHPYVVVTGMDADTVIAVDPRALAVAASPMMTLIDPYSGSTTNSVIVRQETSVAIAVADRNAIGIAAKTIS